MQMYSRNGSTAGVMRFILYQYSYTHTCMRSPASRLHVDRDNIISLIEGGLQEKDKNGKSSKEAGQLPRREKRSRTYVQMLEIR